MVLRAAIFDLGGTVTYLSKDTDELIHLGHQAMTEYLVGEGLDIEMDDVVRVSNGIYEAYRSFAEKSLIELEAQVIYSAILYRLGIVDYSNEDLIGGTINSFFGPIFDDFHIFEDVKQVLGRLKERGLELGLITNNNNSTDFHLRLLEKFDLRKFFDVIVVSSKLGIRKPHRRIFLHCLTKLGVSSESSVFVGDHPIHDVQGAKNIGMRCIWVKRKEHKDISTKPDWIVESIREADDIIVSF